MSVDPGAGVYGTDFVVSGEVLCKGLKVANADVTVYRRYVGSARIDPIQTSTDVQGRYAVRDTNLRASADYSGTWDGTAATGAGASARRGRTTTACSSGAETGSDRMRALVRPGVILNVVDSTLSRGQRAAFYGAVVPGHAGRKVFLQVYKGAEGRWEYVTEVRLDRNSRYTVHWPYNGTGYLLFRIAYPTQDLDHLWNVSRNVRVDWS